MERTVLKYTRTGIFNFFPEKDGGDGNTDYGNRNCVLEVGN